MGDQPRGCPVASGTSEEETQQGGNSRSDDLPIGETEETGRNEIGGGEGRRTSHSRFGSASSDTGNAPPTLSVGAAGGPTARWRENNFDGGEEHKEENDGAGSVKHIQACGVGKGAGKATKDERQMHSDADACAVGLESDAAAANEVEEAQEEAGAAASEDRFDTVVVAPETAYAADARASSTTCATCGTRAELVACAECRRLFHAACDADTRPAADVCVSGLCGRCRAEDSKGRQNTLRENAVRNTVQEEVVLELDGDLQKGLVEGTGRSRRIEDGSDVQPASTMGDVETAAADKSIKDAKDGHMQGHTNMPTEKEGQGESHGAHIEKLLLERDKLHEDSKAGEESSSATNRSAPTAEMKAGTASIKADRSAKPPTGHTSSVDLEAKPTKRVSTKSEAESGALVEDSATTAGQGIKSVEARGTCAEQNTTIAENVMSASDASKSEAVRFTTEGSKPVKGNRSDVENSSSWGDKEYVRRSADPGIAALDTSKSVSESKDGMTLAQEGGGSGAEDEEEEEEGELLQGGMSGESEKKEYMASRKRGGGEAVVRGKPTSPRSLSPSPCHYRRKRRRGENGAVATRYKVNVGPRHQVPALPPFFLDSSCTRDERAESLPETRELYSHDAGDTARLVYSPFAMQRIYRRRLAEGTGGESGIRNAEEMNDFIRKVAENWTNKSGWQPFSPEYAYKLLHFAGYDPQRALRIMKDSRFCFTTICDPPQRRYDNKWRPKDRRGQIATHPYPSPLTLRAYLSRRNQHAAATAAAENPNSRS